MNPKELIDALAVLAGCSPSDEEKAAALDKLSAYFNSLLDSSAEETAEGEATSEAAAEESKDEESTEKASAAEGEEKAETSKEMSSALAQIASLTERVAKFEKASAVGAAPRATKPTVLQRTEPASAPDHVVSMIEAAARNTLRNLSK